MLFKSILWVTPVLIGTVLGVILIIILNWIALPSIWQSNDLSRTRILGYFVAGALASLFAYKARLPQAFLSGLIVAVAVSPTGLLATDISPINEPWTHIATTIGTAGIIATLGGILGQQIAMWLMRNEISADQGACWDYTLMSGEKIAIRSSQKRPVAAWLAHSEGILLVIIGVIASGALIIMGLSRARLPNLSKLVSASVGIFGAFSAIAGTRFKRSRLLMATPVHEAINFDGQKHVLFLRCFHEDRQQGSFNREAGRFGLTAEEAITYSFSRLGTVIAVGRPGESIRVPGALRLYIADDNWQAVVGDIMQRAAAVVFLTGVSEGLGWEINYAMRNVPYDRMCFVSAPSSPFIQGQQRYFKRVALALEKYAGVSLPDSCIDDRVFLFDENRRLKSWKKSLTHPLYINARGLAEEPALHPASPFFGIRDLRVVILVAASIATVLVLVVVYGRMQLSH